MGYEKPAQLLQNSQQFARLWFIMQCVYQSLSRVWQNIQKRWGKDQQPAELSRRELIVQESHAPPEQFKQHKILQALLLLSAAMAVIVPITVWYDWKPVGWYIQGFSWLLWLYILNSMYGYSWRKLPTWRLLRTLSRVSPRVLKLLPWMVLGVLLWILHVSPAANVLLWSVQGIALAVRYKKQQRNITEWQETRQEQQKLWLELCEELPMAWKLLPLSCGEMAWRRWVSPRGKVFVLGLVGQVQDARAVDGVLIDKNYQKIAIEPLLSSEARELWQQGDSVVACFFAQTSKPWDMMQHQGIHLLSGTVSDLARDMQRIDDLPYLQDQYQPEKDWKELQQLLPRDWVLTIAEPNHIAMLRLAANQNVLLGLVQNIEQFDTYKRIPNSLYQLGEQLHGYHLPSGPIMWLSRATPQSPQTYTHPSGSITVIQGDAMWLVSQIRQHVAL